MDAAVRKSAAPRPLPKIGAGLGSKAETWIDRETAGSNFKDERGLVARRFRKARRRRRGIIYATHTKLACPSFRIRLSDLIAMATSVTRRASSRDFKVSPMTRL